MFHSPSLFGECLRYALRWIAGLKSLQLLDERLLSGSFIQTRFEGVLARWSKKWRSCEPSTGQTGLGRCYVAGLGETLRLSHSQRS